MKILVAEDDASSRLVLAATLRGLGYEVDTACDGLEALDLWRRGEFALVISDWLMPGLDGPGLCRAIRSENRAHYTYAILLTSLEGKGNYLAGIEAGADDLITKPLDREVLAARLSVAQRIISLHEALRHEATRDRLTGLLNRGAILDVLQLELDRAARQGGSTAVLLIDIDHFKRVNDTWGHLVGDEVLREVSRRLLTALRPYDSVGRFGGEEFIVLVPGADGQAGRIAERIRSAIADQAFPIAGGQPVAVTASIGVAVGSDSGDDSTSLLGSADRALYRAKDAGRNRVEIQPSS